MNNLAPNGKSPSVSHGVVEGSNSKFSGKSNTSDNALRSGATASFSPSNNNTFASGKTGATSPHGKAGSPVRVDDHSFKIGDAKMPQPNSAVDFERGLVPVNPFTPGGKPSKVAYMKNANK